MSCGLQLEIQKNKKKQKKINLKLEFILISNNNLNIFLNKGKCKGKCNGTNERTNEVLGGTWKKKCNKKKSCVLQVEEVDEKDGCQCCAKTPKGN